MQPFIVKHYSADESPIIKGNGFDGLRVGDDRRDAEEFVRFVNRLIAENNEFHANLLNTPTINILLFDKFGNSNQV